MPLVRELLQLSRARLRMARSLRAEDLDELGPVAPAPEALEGTQTDLVEGERLLAGDGTSTRRGFQLGHPEDGRGETLV